MENQPQHHASVAHPSGAPYRGVGVVFAIFVCACVVTNLIDVWNFWNSDHLIPGWIKIVASGVSLVISVWLLKLHDPILAVTQASKLAEERRRDLEALTRNLEERVNERTRELSHAVAARDGFLSVASHELKTPLTTMKLQTQMRSRRRDSVLPEDLPKYFKSMNDQITRLTNLVDDMLDISHIQRGEFRLSMGRYDLISLVKERSESMRPLFQEKGGELYFESCQEAVVSIDRHRIEQVVDNLLTNALKYAPGVPVQIKINSSAGKVIVSVDDQGPGIRPELKTKIFEKFERAISANEVSGLGLGLFISQTIITAHGGSIWVDSSLGKGSTFYFELPS